MKRVVRLCEVRLENFKNTARGIVTIPEAENHAPFEYASSILGVYGQNGSGKTAIVEVLAILKKLLSNESLKDFPIGDYVMCGKESCTIGVRFSIEQENDKLYHHYYVDYDVRFVHTVDKNGKIQSELLRAEKTEDGKKIRRTLIDYDVDRDTDCYLPKYRYEAIAKNKDGEIAVGVAQRIAQKEKGSFMFSGEFRKAVHAVEKNENDFLLGLILDALYGYASTCLFVITSAHSAMISLNGTVPMNIRVGNEHKAVVGVIPLMLHGPEVVCVEYY